MFDGNKQKSIPKVLLICASFFFRVITETLFLCGLIDAVEQTLIENLTIVLIY